MRFESTIIGLLAAATTAIAVSVPPQAAVAGGLVARQEVEGGEIRATRVKRNEDEEGGDDEHFNPTRAVDHDDPNDPNHTGSPGAEPPVKARDAASNAQVDDDIDTTPEPDDDGNTDQDSSDDAHTKRDGKDKDKDMDMDNMHKASGKNSTNMSNMTMPADAKGAASGVGVSVVLGTVLGGAALFMAL
ncbi:hypothetical protein MCOR25_006449 [Pyricularia grisea]|uniref:Uncharacterized protein n=1 Tax=Pyricularia grisea TaxID=148305 RepID=A0A6P8BD73_PYRGI|nr:uncharacterized protein PgNI_05064 [Pyricularia grisea]KAI6361607.1 hypothetical protein MCOR25_006449 [Pyricularia grisea]TLD13768.1 hypothetical protein PgNI_05064 [Pyricularia grisea]